MTTKATPPKSRSAPGKRRAAAASGTVSLTLLNGMAGFEFERALDQHLAWGIRLLDLKDCIFGKSIQDLTDEEVVLAHTMVSERRLQVATLSTTLFHPDVERGEAFFAETQLAHVARVVDLARVLRPRCIRLLAAQTQRRKELTGSTEYLQAQHPWLIPMYGAAVDRIHAAGFLTVIENEVDRCIWSRPPEIVGFFEALGRAKKVGFMWDIQNLWEMGTFPSLPLYQALRPLIAQIHVKGGMAEFPGGRLKWRSTLADASWPVLDILRAVVRDGVSPVICLNPSHGAPQPGYDYANEVQRDIEFMRGSIPEIAR